MHTARESGYTCTFSTPTGEGSTWVRAWTAQQAQEIVRMLLRERGVEGEISVQVMAESETAGDALGE
jgi:hypothetical protein